MAAITITAASVGIGSGARIEVVEVGEAIAHGDVIYYDTTNLDNRKADADIEATAKAVGIAVTSATGDGAFVAVVRSGSIVLGSVLTQGTEYYLGTTAGTIVPKSDLASGDYVTRLGIAISATTLQVDIRATGVTIP